MPPTPADLKALTDLINSTLELLRTFATFLHPSTLSPLKEPIVNPPHPLNVLRDSATLVKAHTTKISLFAINKPFTPTAITKVLRLLAAECLPAMMSAVQICEQEKSLYSAMMLKECQARVRRVFKEMEVLLQEVLAVSRGQGNARSRDSLSSTGVVWESCDAVIELNTLGIGGLAVQKAEQYRDTIKDAIDELREWKEGEDPDTEGQDELLDNDDEGVEGDRDSVEDIFNAANSMPSDRPELKALVEAAEGKLKKVTLLYTAAVKRRYKTFNKASEDGADEEEKRRGNVERLDRAVESMRRIPHQVDELAACFYDLDEERVKKALEKCVTEAVSAADVLKDDWQGGKDEFTAWSAKWRDVVS
jgi:hypothetical protein